jgi:hypothetical protein
MTLTSTSNLYIAELALYLVILPLTVYLGYRHGRHGLLGYLYLNVFCVVRIVADIVSLLPANQDATRPQLSTAVLSSVGLSPIMLALIGFIHEAHVYLVTANHSVPQARKTKRWLWFAQLQFHAIAILGMVLVIIGSINLVSSTTPLTAAQTNRNDKLRSAGALILLLFWAVLGQYSLYVMHLARRIRPTSIGSVAVGQLTRCIILAVPFVGLRCIYSVLYTFKHTESTLNPFTGALWVKVVFVVLAPLGAVLGMSVGGWLSRELDADRSPEQFVTTTATAFENSEYRKQVRVACEEAKVSASF